MAVRKPLFAALAFLCALWSTGSPQPAAAGQLVSATPTVVLAYAQLLQQINPRLGYEQCRDYALQVLLNAQHLQLDPHLLVALVAVESHWSAQAVSPVGARGLGQLMPRTAAALSIDPTSPHQNLLGTSRYLRSLLDIFKGQAGSMQLAVGAYNAGPSAVRRFGGIPPYGETRAYVAKVLQMLTAVRASVGKTEADAAVTAARNNSDPDAISLPQLPRIDVVAIPDSPESTGTIAAK
jgi:soluble lytic murein transglycosylase-like protein